FMILTTLVWGINLSLIKISLRELRPHAFNGVRLTVSAVLYGFVLLASRRKAPALGRDAWKIIGLAVLGVTLYQWLFIQGIEHTGASTTSLILAMSPVFIAVLSTILGTERIHWAAWLGIAVSIAGFYAVITGPALSFRLSAAALRGDLLLLAANMCWALYTVLSKGLLERIAPLRLAALTAVPGTLLYLPLAARDMAAQRYTNVSWAAWGGLLYSAALAIFAGTIVWYSSLKRVGNAKTAIYTTLNPVFAVLFAALFLSERITPVQGVVAAVILAGVYLTRSGYRLFR
ncbi:MAG: DMT family transporter, partial [Candidatus Aminicenantes bacterium]|nr:DMT family transporter [Candidatus Aminicenantes bacterium]